MKRDYKIELVKRLDADGEIQDTYYQIRKYIIICRIPIFIGYHQAKQGLNPDASWANSTYGKLTTAQKQVEAMKTKDGMVTVKSILK